MNQNHFMRNKILISLVVFALSSCSTYRYIYSASPANNPYFTKKGESKLTGYYSGAGNSSRLEKADGFDLHAAYAIGDHWAVTTGYFNRRERDTYNYSRNNTPFDSSVINYKRNLFDIGAGYFLTLNPKKTITFNLYGGMATGKFSFEDNGTNNGANYNRFHSSDISKWYFQPSINFMPGKYFRICGYFKNVICSLWEYQNFIYCSGTELFYS